MNDPHLSNLTNCKYARCKAKREVTWWGLILKGVWWFASTLTRPKMPVILPRDIFLLWKIFTYSLIAEFIDENSCLLIEIELRRLHRRFDHLSARRLYEILTRSDHDNVESRVIEHLNKYCHHCQMHEKFSERFSFSIRNSDSEFNFNILMNILYIEIKFEDENKLVLHLMNEITRFQVDRWLKNISARHVWDQFRTCWIDTYLRSFDVIITDFDKQFVFREFKKYADNIKIIVKIVSIKAHHSIKMMKRYIKL